MGVYIKGMKMPKEIEPDLVIELCEDSDGKRYARFDHYRYGCLTDWHEVFEVQEPHGRLIDADALKEFFPDKGEGSWTYNIVVSGIIREAPTVIEAEEAE